MTPAEYSTGTPSEGDAVEGVAIDFRVDGSMHVGLLALFTGMFSGRTWAAPPMTHRYSQALAVRVCRMGPQIESMIAASRRAAPAESAATEPADPEKATPVASGR